MSWIYAGEPITRLAGTRIERLWARFGSDPALVPANTSVVESPGGPHYTFIWADDENYGWVRGHDAAAEAQLRLIRSAELVPRR